MNLETLEDLHAHRDAVLSLQSDLKSRAGALESAAVHIASHPKTPIKAFTMQALGRVTNKVSEAYASTSVYLRTLDSYIADCTKSV